MSDKEIKMSDVFSLPVNGTAVHVNIFQLKGHHNDGKTPFELVDLAVNSYDTNQQTIRQQQEVIGELKSNVELFLSVISSIHCIDEKHTIGTSTRKLLEQVKNTLSKLNGGESNEQ